MKRILRIVLISALLIIPVYGEEKEPQTERTVIITQSGKRYHMESCRTLKASRIKISISEAKQRGYTPCGVCKPGE
jgi:hypothetical protein